MLLASDGVQREGWVVREVASGNFSPAAICSREEQALQLRSTAMEFDPKRKALEVVPVLITVHEVAR